MPDFEPIWRRLAQRAEHAAAARREECRQVADLLGELNALGPDDRLRRLEGEQRYWTLALAQALQRQSGLALDPAQALALAVEARTVAAHLPAGRYGCSVWAELLTQVWCTEAESRRRLGDGEGAERALKRAEESLEEEPLDAPSRATFCHHSALLAAERGQLDVALALLGRAAELWEELHEAAALGDVLTVRGMLYLEHGEPDMALAVLEAAMGYSRAAMARGWESKSVESQIEDAGAQAERGRALTPEQRAVQQKREGLELSRRRVLQEIETTRSPARRTSLELALAFLDEELQKLPPA